MSKVKVMLSLDESVAASLKSESKRIGVSMSALVSILLHERKTSLT